MKFLCWHNYERIGFCIVFDSSKNERYPLRRYKCTKCGKEIDVDGRYKNPTNPHKPLKGWFAV